jgi:cysteine desulfurase / selenocysteine lyase
VLGEKATAGYEGAREKVRAFLHAETTREVVFTRSATEAINTVAYAWGLDNLGPGDVVVVTELEHHSNFVPWQYVAGRPGAQFAAIPVADGELDLEALDGLASRGDVKVLAVGHVNNSLGTVNPIQRLTAWAHEQGAICVVDACQSAPHRRLDVEALGFDALSCSAYNWFGPHVGILWGRPELLDSMPPYQGGGDMISLVTFEKTHYNQLPYKFEAGTPHIAGGIGLGAAIDYLNSLDWEQVMAHEHELLAYGTEVLSEFEGLRLIGTAKRKAGVISFAFDHIHAHDVGTILDQEGVAVRAGHHCAMPVMQRFGVPATTRASFALYNTKEEIDALVRGLQRVLRVFG